MSAYDLDAAQAEALLERVELLEYENQQLLESLDRLTLLYEELRKAHVALATETSTFARATKDALLVLDRRTKAPKPVTAAPAGPEGMKN